MQNVLNGSRRYIFNRKIIADVPGSFLILFAPASKSYNYFTKYIITFQSFKQKLCLKRHNTPAKQLFWRSKEINLRYFRYDGGFL